MFYEFHKSKQTSYQLENEIEELINTIAASPAYGKLNIGAHNS